MTLFDYLQQPFVFNAVLVGILIALCSGLLGVPLVLKRFSFIGDGLSHIAFFAATIATTLRLTQELYIVLPATVISAVLLLRTSSSTKVKGDASLAMISVGTLAGGYVVMNMFPKGGNVSADVCSTLFGSTSILTLSESDVILSVVLSIVVVIAFVFFYNKIFAVTFDDVFARGTGVKANLYNLIIATITAVVITLAMNLVGSLLITALIIFPALSSMRVFKCFKSVTICTVIVSVLGAFAGLVISIMLATPVGSTIVVVDAGIFFIFLIFSLLRKKVKT